MPALSYSYKPLSRALTVMLGSRFKTKYIVWGRSMSESSDTKLMIAGAVSAFLINLGGGALAHQKVGSDGSLTGNALLGAVRQGGLNYGLLAAAGILTCCCCYPCNQEMGPAKNFAIGYLPVATVGLLASFVLNMTLTEDKSLGLAANMLGPIGVAATAAALAGVFFAIKSCAKRTQKCTASCARATAEPMPAAKPGNRM